jgi:7,8-dihydropterin-6-yl-methyl-4-(beta-D-ribofuranosyl)aminobenzene 5'-phosphate synthase
MKIFRLNVFLALLLFLNAITSGQTWETLEAYKGVKSVSSGSGIGSSVTFTVIYNNYVAKKGTVADWGFSVLIDGLEERILFDTGTKPEVFEANVRNIGADLSGIDLLILSHEHGDHTGGIPAFVKMKTGIPVLMPVSFTDGFKMRMVEMGLKPVMIDTPSRICQDLYTSGEFKFEIPEEALVLDTKKGLVVLTGCAHPGIINMLKKIRNDFGKNIYMVCGGLHLMTRTKAEMYSIISEMKDIGVVMCGATHCTGEMQIKMFKDAFGDNFVDLGTGNKIVINKN